MEFHLKIEKQYKADKDVHVEMRCKQTPVYSQHNVLLLNGSLRPTLMHEAPFFIACACFPTVLAFLYYAL